MNETFHQGNMDKPASDGESNSNQPDFQGPNQGNAQSVSPTASLPIREHSRTILAIAAILIPVGILLYIIVLIFGTVRSSASQYRTVEETYEEKKEDASGAITDFSYTKGESDYHVSNRAQISVSSLAEKSVLHVFNVHGIEYVPSDDKRTVIEVTCQGSLTAALNMAEFIVDESREFVQVRLLPPEWSDFITVSAKKYSVGSKNLKEIIIEPLFGDSQSRADYAALISKGENLFQNRAMSTQSNLNNAKRNAERIIKRSIALANPDYPDIDVEIVWMDEEN